MMEKCFLTIFEIFVPRVGFDPRTPGFGSKYFEEMGEHVYLLGIASKEIWKVKEMSFRHQKPTAPGVPRRSPIQVLSWPDDA